MDISTSAQILVLKYPLPGSSMECHLPFYGALERLPGPCIATSATDRSRQCMRYSGIFSKKHPRRYKSRCANKGKKTDQKSRGVTVDHKVSARQKSV